MWRAVLGWVATGMWLGLWLGRLGPPLAQSFRLVAAVGLGLALLLAWRARPAWLSALPVCLGLSLGWLLTPAPSTVDYGSLVLEARVGRHTRAADGRIQCQLFLAGAGHLRARDCAPFPWGSRISVRGRVQPPWREDSGVFASPLGRVELDKAQVRTLAAAPWSWRFASAFRAAVRRRMAALPASARPVLAALVLGDPLRVDRPTRSALARLGLMHLFAVSGLHFALLCGACLGGLRLAARGCAVWLPRLDLRRPAYLLAWCVLPVLAAVVGCTASASRAAVLLALSWGLYGASGRRPATLRLLALAVVATLALQPAWAFDLGLCLSVVATWALLSAPSTGERTTGGDLFALSLRVSLATSPITWGVFGQAPWWGVVANPLLAAPLALSFVAGAWMSVVLSFACAPAAELLAAGFGQWVRGCFRLLQTLSEALPPDPRPPTGAAAFLLSCLVVLGILCLRGRQRWLLAPAFLLMLCAWRGS